MRRRTRLNSSLQFGSLGNGITVYDNEREQGGDYLTVAHITDNGMIKYYAEVNAEEKAAINKQALRLQKQWLADWDNISSASKKYELLLDNADTRTLMAIQDDRKSGRIGIIEDVLDKYMPVVFFDKYLKDGYDYPDHPKYVGANSSCRRDNRRANRSVNSARRRANRLNCERYLDSNGDYDEYGYDKEQDGYYPLPDEFYIFSKLNLNKLTPYVKDGVVTNQEISDWLDDLCADFGGVLAWDNMGTRFYPVKRYSVQDLSEEDYQLWQSDYPRELDNFIAELEQRY